MESGPGGLGPVASEPKASEPEQTTSDPARGAAAAAPVWDLICSILESPCNKKTAKHAQPSSGTPTRTHSLPGTLLGASTPPHPPHHVVRMDLHSPPVPLMSDPRPTSGRCSSPLMLSLRLGLSSTGTSRCRARPQSPPAACARRSRLPSPQPALPGALETTAVGPFCLQEKRSWRY